jgi:hypothetical protein
MIFVAFWFAFVMLEEVNTSMSNESALQNGAAQNNIAIDGANTSASNATRTEKTVPPKKPRKKIPMRGSIPARLWCSACSDVVLPTVKEIQKTPHQAVHVGSRLDDKNEYSTCVAMLRVRADRLFQRRFPIGCHLLARTTSSITCARRFASPTTCNATDRLLRD